MTASALTPTGRNWLATGLLALWLLTVFEGAIRKWLLPDIEHWVYIAKDLIVVALLAGWLIRGLPSPMAVRRGVLQLLMLLYGGWCAVAALNPALPNLFVGLFGFKAHALYLSLMVLVPAAFASSEQLERFWRRALWVAIPVLLLGIAQFYAPVDSVLNKYARGENTAVFGSDYRVRVAGTFPYITGMTSFIFLCLCLSLGLLAGHGWKLRGNLLPVAVACLALAVAPMTGSRGLLYTGGIAFALLLLALAYGGRLRLRRVLVFAVPAAIAVVVTLRLASDAIQSFEDRRQAGVDLQQRIANIYSGPLEMVRLGGVAGFGAGATHPAALYLAEGELPYGWLPPVYFEEELGRVALELGGTGLLLTLALRSTLLLFAFLLVVRTRSPAQLAMAATALMFIAPHAVLGIVFNSSAGIFYWLAAGSLIVVWRELQERAEQTAPEAAAVAPSPTA